ncbi:hypothetical protein LLH23_12730 [bacterium]|nr:hypothetical protein [bacterium]
MTRHRTLICLIGLLAVVLLWHQVFVMTGVLWWNAPAPAQRLSALPALDLPRPDIRLVSLDAYLAAHPEWSPR